MITKAELRAQIEALEKWKGEAMELIDPFLEYGHNHPGIKVGQSICTFILERCRKFDEMKRRQDICITALDDIHRQSYRGSRIRVIAGKALSDCKNNL